MEDDTPIKYFDTAEVVLGPTDQPGLCFPRSISLIPKGTSNNRRCGKVIHVRSIEWTGILLWRYLQDPFNNILQASMRLVLVRQKTIDPLYSVNGPPFIQVFQNTYISGNSSNICSQLNWDFMQDYEVLYNEIFEFDLQAGRFNPNINKSIVSHVINGVVELDEPREMRFSDFAGTPQIQDVLAGHLYWYILDHVNDPYSYGEVNLLSTRITYSDQ